LGYKIRETEIKNEAEDFRRIYTRIRK